MRNQWLFAGVGLAALAMVGCENSGGIREDAAPVSEVGGGSGADDAANTQGLRDGQLPAGQELAGTVETGGIDGGSGYTAASLDDPNSLLSTRTVYFDYDSSDLDDETRNVLQAHAQYLADNPDVRIVLRGHTDERGSREYNIGLGERRGKSVKRFMSFQGVDDSQLEVVSYGEEQPVAFGHDEASWRQNRRVELRY